MPHEEGNKVIIQTQWGIRVATLRLPLSGNPRKDGALIAQTPEKDDDGNPIVSTTTVIPKSTFRTKPPSRQKPRI